MTVRANILYGFRYHCSDKNLMNRRLTKLIDELNISHLMDRYPSTLSGGEMQRTALARAMMIEPRVLMLDEPLSALDPKFRMEIQDLLRRLHESRNITFLMVTHDFSEALSLADRAAVMKDGTIEQIDEVSHLFRKPASQFVADFVGMKNILPVSFNNAHAESGSLTIYLGGGSHGKTGFIAIRPEDIVLSCEPLDSSMRNCFSGTVSAVIDRGFVFEVVVRRESHEFTSLVTKGSLSSLNIHLGGEIYFSFKATAIHSF